MSTLTLLLIRLAFLAVLWLFVITAVGVVRTDLPPRPAKPGRSEPQRLLVTGGALSGTTLPLTEQQITIGRSNDATLVLNDDYASSRHARLFPQDGQWIVEDLGSTNGTYLDRQKVTQPTPVPTGVPIRIGKTVLELRR
jgi:pSer/pThr/pTyr-binding forkhead associated (FHA) protein